MFDRLHEVDWDRLHGAYGPATEVPGLIRALAGPDTVAADKARGSLGGSVVHQGTTYSASAPAVPFLVELVDDPAVPDRAGIAWLLGDLVAHGNQRTRHLGAVRAAVAAELGRLLPLLHDDDPRLRAAMSFVVSQSTKSKRDIVRRLRERFAVEDDPQVRALLLSAVAWMEPNTDLVAAALNADNPPVLRAAAALVLARSDAPWTPEATAAVQAGWSGGEVPRPCPWWPQPLRDLLRWMGRRGPAAAPVLAVLLRLPEDEIRAEAATAAIRAIGLYRSVRPALVPALTGALDDPVPAVRATAAIALRDAGPLARTAIDALARLAAAGTDEAAGEAAAAVAELGDPRWPDLLVPRIAAGHPVSDAIGVLAAKRVAFDAALCDALLHRLGLLTRETPPPARLPRWIWRFPQSERDSILELLAAWGPAAATAVPRLLALDPDHHEDTPVNRALAATFAAIGDTAALPWLRAEIDAAGADERAAGRVARVNARLAIWRIAGDAGPALAAARTALDEIVAYPDLAAYHDVVPLLDGLGERAGELLPNLRELLAQPVRGGSGESGMVDVARLVWRLTGDRDAIVPAVRRLLGNGLARVNSRSGSGAGRQIALAGELGDPALVEVLRELRDREPRSAAAALALWRLTGDSDGLAEAVVPAFTRRPPSPVWPEMADVLRTLGPAATPALPALRELVDDDRCPFTDVDHDAPSARGIGHKDERFLATLRHVITAIVAS
ncbi:hypothetical protein [Actinoplanes sp. NPDC049265]|uniref:hypothetical protein n=1 Tax=Actinoplanes sp. NPDC049265 TaxID=3363902 RepID=UPI003721C352